ncbi:MAG TPA: PilZ domain-containing protein [Hyphomicrobiaceae bacterium]|nr:PilZ domain-containing protein [Hyphomicrobiaceae bacterium]
MLQSLRSKLFTPEPTATGEQAGELDGTGLLEAIVCETQTAALHAAVVLSGLNALQAGGRIKGPLALKDFILGQSAVIRELLRAHEEAGLDTDTMVKIHALFDELASARITMERLLADAGRPAAERPANVSYGAAVAEWSRVCHRALDAASALESGFESRGLPDYYSKNSRMLERLLTDAIEGRSPCVDDAGQPFLPDMPQRRRSARRSLLQQCSLRYRGKTAPVIAKDISTTGMGIERTPDLKNQELVQIELNGGRRLIGLVVWTKGTTAGVRFGKHLPPNDPLLVG